LSPADVRKVAERLVPALTARGATAVVLTGSVARGEATNRSDLDLVIVGDGPGYLLRIEDGVLVSESWATEDAHRARFGSPREVGSSIPGWREASVLHDPDGAAARLREEALSWTWEELGASADEWVAEELTGFVEEVQKLAGALAEGRTLTAAAQRDTLALRLAPILAVHHRLLHGSENAL
jgi:predicted nucleotidyltransferase